ncbi:hypothetical protein LTR74_005338 [Friedmanniomyces endolithicus]|nr:hypothetical protein LTR74_005338 [Friedmanniomyces endolithicus]
MGEAARHAKSKLFRMRNILRCQCTGHDAKHDVVHEMIAFSPPSLPRAHSLTVSSTLRSHQSLTPTKEEYTTPYPPCPGPERFTAVFEAPRPLLHPVTTATTMSLADSLKAFKSERAEVVSRNAAHSRPTTTGPISRTSTPKPSSGANNNEKRTHDAAFSSSRGVAGGEIMRLVVGAVEKLKDNDFKPLSWLELLRYMSLPLDLRGAKGEATFKRALQSHHRLQYIHAKDSADGLESFRYKPLHSVTNGEELRDYLARLETAQGVPVKELKDGWPDCCILVSRSKKDGTPHRVYPDNPRYHITTAPPNSSTKTTKAAESSSAAAALQEVVKISPDFQAFYSNIRLPANDNDLRAELEKAGLTPTSAVREVSKGPLKKKERKRVDRKNAKKTNVHLAGLLKDYSKVKAAKAANG